MIIIQEKQRQLLENLALVNLLNVYPTVPPRVDYSLTPLGESLAEPLAVLGEWAYRHISEVNAAIEQYDNSPKLDDFWQPKLMVHILLQSGQ